MISAAEPFYGRNGVQHIALRVPGGEPFWLPLEHRHSTDHLLNPSRSHRIVRRLLRRCRGVPRPLLIGDLAKESEVVTVRPMLCDLAVDEPEGVLVGPDDTPPGGLNPPQERDLGTGVRSDNS